MKHLHFRSGHASSNTIIDTSFYKANELTANVYLAVIKSKALQSDTVEDIQQKDCRLACFSVSNMNIYVNNRSSCSLLLSDLK